MLAGRLKGREIRPVEQRAPVDAISVHDVPLKAHVLLRGATGGREKGTETSAASKAWHDGGNQPVHPS